MSRTLYSETFKKHTFDAMRSLRILAPIVLFCGSFALSALLAGFLAFALSLPRVETPIEADAEGVVALTGGSERVLEAAELLARGQARRLLITGVNPATRDADLARILPMSKELFACCVDLGYRAHDTAGNALETRDWVKAHAIKGPLIIVTSNYHMPRALAELSASMPGMTLYPYSVVSEHVNVANLADRRVLALLGREYLKYLRAIVRARIGRSEVAEKRLE